MEIQRFSWYQSLGLSNSISLIFPLFFFFFRFSMAAAQPAIERAYGVTNIKSHIPLILDLDDFNYDAWRELFLTHCLTFDVTEMLMEHWFPTEPTMSLGRNVMALSSCGSTVRSHHHCSRAHSKLAEQRETYG